MTQPDIPFAEKIKSLYFGTRGRTRDKVVDGRRPNGERCKSTTDENNVTVTESAERQDVTIRPRTIHVTKDEVRRVAK